MSLLKTISYNGDDIIFTTTEILLQKSTLNTEYSNGTYSSDVIYNSDSDNQTLFANDTYGIKFEHKEYIFDRKEVRFVFITLYSLVFCFCFFGKSVINYNTNFFFRFFFSLNQGAVCARKIIFLRFLKASA